MKQDQQSAKGVLMIHPACFGYNPETHVTNHYQVEADKDLDQIHAEALEQFDALKALLEQHDVPVHVFENDDMDAPDAIFPNAASAHPEGVALYPMLQPSRQRERSPEFVSFLTDTLGYKILHDFSGHETEGRALEATAALVMDRVNGVAYSGRSQRSDRELARMACDALGFDLVPFDTQDHTGAPVYHTDVLMYIGSGYAGICLDCIVEGREAVESALSKTHAIVPLERGQLLSMCGNALEVAARDGKRYLVMSEKAFQGMRADQLSTIETYVDGILHTDLSTVEKYGGGSARCMLMDLH